MDFLFARLRRIQRLFAHEWDAFLIATLAAAGPLRYGQLANEMTLNCGRRLSDSTVVRTRDRLVRQGLVECVDDGLGHPVHRLTESGRRQAQLLAAMAESIKDELDLPRTRPTAQRPA
ncbi:MAG: hypothetical protein IRY85_17820 [Micromonosporaceae bacterium]|nr:hypothetical protein [Micromonosporaceae bacterium]